LQFHHKLVECEYCHSKIFIKFRLVFDQMRQYRAKLPLNQPFLPSAVNPLSFATRMFFSPINIFFL
jgi:hypothetical protein